MIENRILLLGGGGHCRSVLDCLQSLDLYDSIGIVDFDSSATAIGVPVVGSDDNLPSLLESGWTNAFITVGSIGSTNLRRKLYSLVKSLGFNVPSIVDTTAVIARGVSIGEGVFIGKRTVVNTGASVGDCAIINTGAIIEHDCKIGEFSHVSPGAVLCGQVSVGCDTHIGAGSAVRQCINIGNNAVIGMGSVVINDIADGTTSYGNPSKVANQ